MEGERLALHIPLTKKAGPTWGAKVYKDHIPDVQMESWLTCRVTSQVSEGGQLHRLN
jgi:hypothetical protein